MASVVALEDGLDSSLALSVSRLHAKREQLTQALRFASSVREGLMEGKEVCCPVCLDSQLSALSVLPECFHTLCAPCLERTAAGRASFRCPLCRVQAGDGGLPPGQACWAGIRVKARGSHSGMC